MYFTTILTCSQDSLTLNLELKRVFCYYILYLDGRVTIGILDTVKVQCILCFLYCNISLLGLAYPLQKLTGKHVLEHIYAICMCYLWDFLVRSFIELLYWFYDQMILWYIVQ